MMKLSEMYRHPLEKVFPSPQPRTRGGSKEVGKQKTSKGEKEAEKVGQGLGEIEISIDESRINEK